MKNLLTYSLFLLLSGFLVMSCGEDDPVAVKGCTDSEADNYNELATESDDSCTYFDRISGTFTGTFDCAGFLAAILIDETTLSIGELSKPSTVGISVVTTLDFPIPLIGNIVDKNTIDVGNTIENIPLPEDIDILPAHEGEQFDITVSGQLVLSEDGSMISGTLTFVFKEVALNLNIADQTDSCLFTATRQ